MGVDVNVWRRWRIPLVVTAVELRGRRLPRVKGPQDFANTVSVNIVDNAVLQSPTGGTAP